MINLANLGLLLLALTLAVVSVASMGTRAGDVRAAVVRTSAIELVRDAAGVITQVVDVDGQRVAVQPFQKIVSLGLVSDAALLDVCEPARVAGWSSYTIGPRARRLSPAPRINGLENIEKIIALAPDLVIVSTYGGEVERITRLRDAGLTVFCLGPMTGLAAYAEDLERIGALVGHHDEARRSADNLRWRLARVSAGLAVDAVRPRALYVSRIGDSLFGGTIGTSYHEILTAGGCHDAAAEQYRGWPQFSVEQLIDLQPDLILTRDGMSADLKRLPGMERLAATRFIELPGWMLEDPGPSVLEAAEAVYREVHGQPR